MYLQFYLEIQMKSIIYKDPFLKDQGDENIFVSKNHVIVQYFIETTVVKS